MFTKIIRKSYGFQLNVISMKKWKQMSIIKTVLMTLNVKPGFNFQPVKKTPWNSIEIKFKHNHNGKKCSKRVKR